MKQSDTLLNGTQQYIEHVFTMYPLNGTVAAWLNELEQEYDWIMLHSVVNVRPGDILVVVEVHKSQEQT